MNNRIAIALAAAGLAIIAAPAQADTRDDVLAGVARCGVIRDDRVWLDCVYGAQQPMRAKLGLTPAPELQQRLVPGVNIAPPGPPPPRTVAAKPRKKAGFIDRLFTDTDPDTAPRMAAYHFEKNGAFVVELENGEKWRQTDIEGGSVSWNRQPSTYRVIISEGAFGSYSLRVTDNPRTYRVARVR